MPPTKSETTVLDPPVSAGEAVMPVTSLSFSSAHQPTGTGTLDPDPLALSVHDAADRDPNGVQSQTGAGVGRAPPPNLLDYRPDQVCVLTPAPDRLSE